MVPKKDDKRDAGKRRGAKKLSDTGVSSSRPAPPQQATRAPKTPVKKGIRAENRATGEAALTSAQPAVRPQKLPAVVRQAPPPPRPKLRPPPPPLVQGNSLVQRARILLQPQRTSCPATRRKPMNPEVAKALTQLNNCVRLSPLRPPAPEGVREITPDSCHSFSSGRNERRRRTPRSSSPFSDPLSAHKSAPDLSSTGSIDRQPRSYSMFNKYDPYPGSMRPSRDLPRQTSTPNISIRSSIQNLTDQFADRPSQPKNSTPDKSLDTLHTYVTSIEDRISSMEVNFIPSVEKLIQDVSNSIHLQMSKKVGSNNYRLRRCMESSSESCVRDLPPRNNFSSCSSTSLPKREITNTRYVERMDQVTRRLFKNKDFMLSTMQTSAEDSPSSSDKRFPSRGETPTRP